VRSTPMPDFRPFAHATAPTSAAYRAALQVFAAAKTSFRVHLRPEDVVEALPAIGDPAALLTQLVAWGNLRADPDTSRVTTVEDFLRPRHLYSLTPAGEAAERALQAYDEALGRRAELQSVALSDIRDLLGELAVLDAADTGKVHRSLSALSGRFRGLADNASAFMGSVQRAVDLVDGDEQAFIAYKDRLVDYLQRFVRDLVVLSADIAERLDAIDPGPLLAAAARHEAADAAPDGTDDADAAALRLAEWTSRWHGLTSWFVGDRGHPSQSSLLRDRARAAVPALLAAAATLHERRSGRSDRSADFRALARWFAEAESDADCHRLWRAVFGLSPARHLTVDAETLERRRERPVPPSTPWADAPPIDVAPRLRRTGSAERRGRPTAVEDRSAARRHLAELAATERAQVHAARRRFATGRPTRLSDLGALDPVEFRLLLGLLGDALAALHPGEGEVETTTSDGSLLLRLSRPAGGAVAEIRTADGVLRGPDCLLTVADLDGAGEAAS
jgi:uncharacterized protein (TIGR02677 family)